MPTWTDDELTRIGKAEELNLASRRPDGSLRNLVTMWVVRDGDELYVRAYKGPDGPWYRGTRDRQEGHVRSGGVEADVSFTDETDPDVNDRIDAAYQAKYARWPDYVGPMITPQARAATIRLTPHR
jgi:hypothetical protein